MEALNVLWIEKGFITHAEIHARDHGSLTRIPTVSRKKKTAWVNRRPRAWA
jgi:hypothetical protein